MKIELLIEREDALNVISKTLVRYWKDREKLEIEIADIENFNLELIVNSRLNYISFLNTENKEFRVIKKEFGTSTNIVKLPFQIIYVFLACSKLFRRFFSTHKLYFKTQGPVRFDQNLIIGGNHRIRINSKQEGLSTVIIKEGFDKKWMKNEILFRVKNQHLDYLKLFNYDRDFTWYDEQFMEGIPCNRILNKKERLAVSNSALSSLNREIASPNIFQKPMVSYWNEQITYLKENINLTNNFVKGIEEKLRDLIVILESAFVRIKQDGIINLTYTHGDFQPANILETKRGIRIIDWEEIKIRTCYYDLIVFWINSRNTISFKDELSSIFNNVKVLEDWMPTDIHTWKDACFLCFCLEEVIYHFSDYCSNSFYSSGKGLSPILKEFKDFIKENYTV